MRILSFLIGGLVLLGLLATPALADKNKGKGGGTGWSQSGGDRDDDRDDDRGRRPQVTVQVQKSPQQQVQRSNSGGAHWCKANWWKEGHGNRGGCVSQQASVRGFNSWNDDGFDSGKFVRIVYIVVRDQNGNDDNEDEDNEDQDNEDQDNDDEDNGEGRELDIDRIVVRNNGTFRVTGDGAEDKVIVSVSGVSGLVVGFGETDPNSNREWVVEGEWGCQGNESSYEARVTVRDSDERDGKVVRFPCDDLDED